MNAIQALFEKVTGIDKIRAKAAHEAAEALRLAKEAEAAAVEAIRASVAARQSKEEAEEEEKKAKEAERIAKLTPKELATEKKEPYIAVLDTKVNEENPRNGFFELDWNEYFIVQLRDAGYYGETDEELVDRWFQDLCRNIGNEAGLDMDRRGSGYINVNQLGNGKSEIS